MVIHKRIQADYFVSMMCIMAYFIPRYLEYTTFVNIGILGTLIAGLKAASYLLALVWLFIRAVRGRKCPLLFLLVITAVLGYFTYQAGIKKHNTLFIVLLFSLVLDECYFDRYLTVILRSSVVLYVLTLLASAGGLIENVTTSRNKFGSVWVAGGNGFGYSGQMIMMLIPIVFMYYYKHDGRIRWWDHLLWVAVSALVYYRCKTIMGFALILLFIVLYAAVSCSSAWMDRVMQSFLVRVSAVIFCGVSLLLIILYNKGLSIGTTLDVVVNGRLSVASRVIQRYGIRLLGTGFVNNVIDDNYEILDSEYVHMLVSGGIVYLLIVLAVCVCIMRLAQKRGRTLTLIWLMIFFNAVFNNGIFGLVMNPFSILLVPALRSGLRSGLFRRKIRIRRHAAADEQRRIERV